MTGEEIVSYEQAAEEIGWPVRGIGGLIITGELVEKDGGITRSSLERKKQGRAIRTATFPAFIHLSPPGGLDQELKDLIDEEQPE